MRAIMHQDRESKLARADKRDGEQIGHRIGPPRDQRDRAQYQRPRVRDQRCAPPARTPAQIDQLLLRQEIASAHAKRGHGGASRSDWVEADTSRSPTRRRRAAARAGLAVVCSPSTRNISARSSSGKRPMA